MTMIILTRATCSSTGWATHEDRRAEMRPHALRVMSLFQHLHQYPAA